MKKFDVPKSMTEWKVLGTTKRSQAAVMEIAPGDKEGGPENRHDTDQWLFVLSGKGHVTLEGKQFDIGRGTLLLIEAHETHEIANRGRTPLRTLNFYAPANY